MHLLGGHEALGQDKCAASADRIGGYAGGYRRKIEAAGWVRAAGLPLTVTMATT